jgi:hypothetical protein
VASSNPNGGVAITVSPNDNDGEGNGTTQFTRDYNNGTVVTLTAPTTADGNTFSNWSGCTSTAGTTCTVTMNADKTVTANYVTNPTPGNTCSVFPFLGVFSQPFPFTFALILQNYTGSPQTISVHALIGGSILRARTITLDPDRFVGLGPNDIPLLNGELADLYVCWPLGGPTTPVPPSVLVFLSIGTTFTIEPPVAVFGF